MNREKWRYHVVVCMAVCLILFCAMMAKEAEKTAIMQDKWTEDARMRKERVEVSAENQEASAECAKTFAEREEMSAVNDAGLAKHAETLVEGSKLHTQGSTATSDAICLPTGKIVRGFGWQEEDGAWRYHSGIDIAYIQGEQVRIVRGGTVHRVERVAGGYAVEVKSGEELWRYEPLARVSVAAKEHVGAGNAIGMMQEGITLHIGCQHEGVWTDPMSMQN